MAQSASLHVPVCGGHTEGAKNTHRSAKGQEGVVDGGWQGGAWG